ncbi:hypothetical protein [Agarilytica rhodophyticola]|uniref:hypothetical protein n=1 Tax=Agarilytica rhodophyticola TaxID=1737490 RepID=UPI000B344C14|nr:hypothetical protein [Agarilytica rhodophyticola]
MTKQLQKIIHLINTGDLLSTKIFSAIDIDSALDKRDSGPFDSHWMSAFNETESIYKKMALNEQVIASINKIRELAFKAVKEAADSEIAAYVSDDFELIAKSVVINSTNLWVSALFSTYISGNFPYGDLEPQGTEIAHLLTTA